MASTEPDDEAAILDAMVDRAESMKQEPPMKSDETARADGAHEVTPRSASSDYVRSRWPFLAPHIREAIIALVDAGLLQQPNQQPDTGGGKQ